MGRSKQTARRVFVALVVVSILLLGTVVFPFIEALFLGAVLAGALHGLQNRLATRLGGRRGVAAALLTFATIVVLVVPTSILASFVVKQGAELGRTVISTMQSDGFEGLVQKLPPPLRGPIDKVRRDYPAVDQQIEKTVGASPEKAPAGQEGDQAKAAVAFAGTVITTTGAFLFQLAMMLIALYFLLIDGHRLAGWLEDISPLQEGQTTEILHEFRTVSVGVLVSNAATSGVQAVAAFGGYVVAGVPQPLVVAVATFFIAFVPAIGAGGTVLAASALLLATGEVVPAIGLAAWGVLVVGNLDNILTPYLLRHGMRMHGAVLFFALVGGLTFFGAIGLLLGPLIVAFFVTLVRIHQRERGRGLVVDPHAPATPPGPIEVIRPPH